MPSLKWTAPVLLAAAGAEGEPRRWTSRAYSGGPMQVSAPKLDAPIVIDLAGVRFSDSIVANLFHDDTRIVGHVTEKSKRDGGIDLAGNVSGGGPDAQHFLKASADGFPWGASVEADQLKIVKLAAGKSLQVNGRTITGPMYIARSSNVYGVAFLGRAADSQTTVTLAAGAADLFKEQDMEYSQWLASLGFDDETKLTDAQKVKLAAKFKEDEAAALKAGKGVDPPAFDLDGLKAAYEGHIATIEAKAFEYDGKAAAGKIAPLKAAAFKAAVALKQSALAQEWAPMRFEVEAVKAASKYELDLLTASAPTGPAIHASGSDVSQDVIQAALCRSANLQNFEKAFKPEVLEASDKFQGIGLQEIILMAAHQNGYSGRQTITMGNAREVMQAAFSTHTLTTLITQTGNKMLLDGFQAIPQSWRRVAKVESVNDFKTTTAFRMNANLEYEELGPAGEIKHGTASQESYDLKAVTYAKMLAITLQDIVNDDLRAFDQIRQKLGIGAAVKMSNLFWQTWLTASNAGVFWAAGHSNLATACALSLTNLATAVQKFRDMEGPDGNLMELDPTLLLVPSALEATAKTIFSSQEIRDTTASTKAGTTNIYQGQFVPVAVPQLAKSTFTGYSATTWWLAADPAILASAAMVFLNGQQTPVIESSEADFNTLGVQFRGYHHFGAAMTEYRGSVKCTV